jgi:hypothetical protein
MAAVGAFGSATLLYLAKLVILCWVSSVLFVLVGLGIVTATVNRGCRETSAYGSISNLERPGHGVHESWVDCTALERSIRSLPRPGSHLEALQNQSIANRHLVFNPKASAVTFSDIRTHVQEIVISRRRPKRHTDFHQRRDGPKTAS